jgi:P pilus assembly chaperone PapD
VWDREVWLVGGIVLGAFVGALAACLMLGLAWSAPASAQLSINKLWVEFERGTAPRTDLVIRNDSKDRYYITVKAFEITGAGTEQEARLEIPDPEKLGLLVTPNRLVLDPGSSRSIRVVSLNQDLKQERVYRVLITPQVGELNTATKKADDEQALAIKMLAAYDVLVLAKPDNAAPDIQITRSPTEVVMLNAGNSNVLLSGGRVCPDKKLSDACAAIKTTRLYAGTSLRIPVTSDKNTIIIDERKSLSSDAKSMTY